MDFESTPYILPSNTFFRKYSEYSVSLIRSVKGSRDVIRSVKGSRDVKLDRADETYEHLDDFDRVTASTRRYLDVIKTD
jgi:hypothetical protein